MHEMLWNEGSVDPLEVLVNLRSQRARLVENFSQYNLSLEILEELLYGQETIVPSATLETYLDCYVTNSVAQYHSIKAFPTPLTYKAAADSAFHMMNRDNAVLPADSKRIYLEMENGEPASQYINAVQIAGLNQQEAFIVTEHPLPRTLGQFWRLVVERACSMVILINQFNEWSNV